MASILLTSATVNSKAEELKRRTKKFAIDIIAFVRQLPASDDARDIGRQLVRSGTGVGSNYRASCRARSQAEFIARIGIVLEEADESAFWLEVLTESGVTQNAATLMDEANQLSAIFAQSSITARQSLKRRH
jgi:four helix bundle protein